eukprot:gene1020-1154_t
MGEVFLKLNRPLDAIILYKIALHVDAGEYVAWTGLGKAYSLLGDSRRSAFCIKRALQLLLVQRNAKSSVSPENRGGDREGAQSGDNDENLGYLYFAFGKAVVESFEADSMEPLQSSGSASTSAWEGGRNASVSVTLGGDDGTPPTFTQRNYSLLEAYSSLLFATKGCADTECEAVWQYLDAAHRLLGLPV